ncbi:MAG TPA: HlyD family efflux transporter periplasmic adaptor subunit [Thermoanaerobaculia bacterium]|nr:HlyD family efflux transporter periplasmic adaptor subunit [Thermoanaerobaculia bacterium]
MRARAFLALLAAGVGAAALTACRGNDDGVIHLQGRLEAPLVDVGPKVAGRVLEVRVREGDRVKAGDVLVRLDLGETAIAVDRDREGLRSAEAKYQDMAEGSRPPEIQAAQADVADKKAAVDLAKRELDRQQTLLDKKIGSRQDFDVAKTALDRAQAALQSSEERLRLANEGFRKFQTEQARFDRDRAKSVLAQSETLARESELRAPADAVVLHRIAEPGLLLSAGQPALTLAFADRLYVRTFIPEPKLGKVRTGMAATVAVDAFPGRLFPAHVAEISPDPEFTPKPVETRAERVNLVYAAKIDLDLGWKEPLVPGQPADVAIPPGAAAR